MLLSSSVAEQIVDQLSKVMDHHINIMDINGTIISSTDPKRIGTTHGGAVRIIKERLKELLIEADGEYIGAKNGINLPIEFNNEIIGVIGLTGRSEEVFKYGQIIKKMTEVLLLDTYVREQKNIEQKAKDRFLEEWIFGRYDTNHPQEFKARAQMLGIDTHTPKRVLVFSVKKDDNTSANDQLQTDISHRIRSHLKSYPQSFLFRTSTLFICVFNRIPDEEIKMIAKEIEVILTDQFKCRTFIGIDSDDPKPIKVSFKNANTALQASIKSNDKINIYDVVNFDIFINTMLSKYKEDFLDKFFNQSSQTDIKEYIDILRVFYACEGSINDASQELFIHKNTLQYRLNKIYMLTGFDPRKISLSYMFIIAIKIYDSLQSEKE
ncbi:MAG: helix-turn-helix domain-containing protein [Firmicutes bacterium]|nr:helix-turn-helix domain-containing protein [Bacillota bacterium]